MLMDQSPPRIFETTFTGTRFLNGKRAPHIERFNTPSEANAWAAAHEPVRFFGWQESVPEDFDGYAVEEQRFLRGEHGNKSRVWAMPADVGDQKLLAAGKPMSAPPRPSFTATSFEIAVVLKGHLGPIREHCDTYAIAQESAAQRCRELGFQEYVEATEAELRNSNQDGVYLVTCTTRHEAVSI